jgi:hypothetical protein
MDSYAKNGFKVVGPDYLNGDELSPELMGAEVSVLAELVCRH